MNSLPQPNKFWEIRVQDLSDKGKSGLCVGYERGVWRKNAFIDYIMEWLPEFSLNSKERDGLIHANAVDSLKKVAMLVYKTEKFKNRGEFGEIFLHAAIRSVFNSVPAISKIYYKSSHNETVKGFDCVHVVGPVSNLELWIGEVKFYDEISRAIRDVISELKEHLKVDFLRDEFVLISNKLDGSDPHANEVQKIISKRNSMDNIFKRIRIPILLTYESNTVKQYKSICDEYKDAFNKEITGHYLKFIKKFKDLPPVSFHLFLLPIENKAELVSTLDTKLKAWQTI
jgi:hypothetical protein